MVLGTTSGRETSSDTMLLLTEPPDLSSASSIASHSLTLGGTFANALATAGTANGQVTAVPVGDTEVLYVS